MSKNVKMSKMSKNVKNFENVKKCPKVKDVKKKWAKPIAYNLILVTDSILGIMHNKHIIR